MGCPLDFQVRIQDRQIHDGNINLGAIGISIVFEIMRLDDSLKGQGVKRKAYRPKK